MSPGRSAKVAGRAVCPGPVVRPDPVVERPGSTGVGSPGAVVEVVRSSPALVMVPSSPWRTDPTWPDDVAPESRVEARNMGYGEPRFEPRRLTAVPEHAGDGARGVFLRRAPR